MEVSELYYKAYEFIKNSDDDVQVHQGGTSSGKTYSILQCLFTIAGEVQDGQGEIITVCGQDIPNLKAGALRDALNIYITTPEIKAKIKSYNKSDRIFEYFNGSIIEFKSYDSFQDAKSGKRSYLFVNEANGIPYPIYQELAIRTKNKVFIDYNPNAGFWAHEFIIGRPKTQLVISDHRDNAFLDQRIRDKIEALKHIDIEQWKVYARGLTGRIEGMIFTNWFICDYIPEDAKFIGYGLDFGFTNDETGCIEVWMQNGELWVDELIYETNLTNPDISRKLKEQGVSKTKEIIADSAEPKSIEELKRMGWFINGAAKGPDSIKNSIDILKRYRINVTRGSVWLRKELERYTWRKDKISGRSLQEPVDTWNHLIDPLRYVALNKLKVHNKMKASSRLPYQERPTYNGDFDLVR